MDPSTGAIPKRPRKKKAKEKISFGSTNSGYSCLPCHLQANLKDLITLFETAQKGQGGEHQSGLATRAIAESWSTAAATTGNNCDDSVQNNNPMVEDSQVATTTVVDHQSEIGEAHQVARIHEREPKILSDTDVMDIVRAMRQLLLEKNPLQENEWAKAVSPTHAKLVLEVHESMTAFLSRHPGFVVVHEDLYSLVYYEDPDVEGEGGSALQTEHELITGPSPSANTKSGRQDAAASDVRPDRATISSSRPHQSTTEGEQREEEEEHALKDAGMQETYPPRSPAMRRRKTKSKAMSRREWCRVSKIAETMSTNETRDSDVVHGQEKQQAPKTSPEKARQPRENVGERPHVPRPGSWFSAEVQKKSPVTKEAKHTNAKANVKVKPQLRFLRPIPRPLPRPRQRRRNLPPHLRPKNDLHTPPAESIRESPAEGGKRCSRSSKPRPPVSKYQDPRGVEMQAAAPSSEIASVLPAKEETAKKSNIEEKLSRIARMAKDRRPDVPEKDIRMKIDHLRKSRGGLTGMTYNEIVALVLELLDAL